MNPEPEGEQDVYLQGEDRFIVIREHKATDETQLNLELHEIVYVLERDETGWWGGQKEGEDTTGWFPGNCVQPHQQPHQHSYPRAHHPPEVGPEPEHPRDPCGPIIAGPRPIPSPQQQPSIHAELARAKDENAALMNELSKAQTSLHTLSRQHAAETRQHVDEISLVRNELQNSVAALQQEQEQKRKAVADAEYLRNRVIQLEEELQQEQKRKTVADSEYLRNRVIQLEEELQQACNRHTAQLKLKDQKLKETEEQGKKLLREANDRQKYAEDQLREQIAQTARAMEAAQNNDPARKRLFGSVADSAPTPAPKGDTAPTPVGGSPAPLNSVRIRESSYINSSPLPPPAPNHRSSIAQPQQPPQMQQQQQQQQQMHQMHRSPQAQSMGNLTPTRVSVSSCSANATANAPNEVPPPGTVAQKLIFFERQCSTPRRGNSSGGLESMRRGARTDSAAPREDRAKRVTAPVHPRAASRDAADRSFGASSGRAIPNVTLAPPVSLTLPLDAADREDDGSEEPMFFNMSPIRKNGAS